MAAMSGFASIVTALMAAGADLEAKDNVRVWGVCWWCVLLV
jgi:hypothetical protein